MSSSLVIKLQRTSMIAIRKSPFMPPSSLLAALPIPLFTRRFSCSSVDTKKLEEKEKENVQKKKFFIPKSLNPLVIAGPSGSGKSTLIARLLQEYPEVFGFSVSHTTRKPRPGEIDGVHYHFVSPSVMNSLVSRSDFFVENATFAGNQYGTSFDAIGEVRKLNKICLLDVDLQGILTLKKQQSPSNPSLASSTTTSSSPLSCRYFFIVPPSLQALRKRLELRGETIETINKRVGIAESELRYKDIPGFFDAVIVNDDREKAYSDLEEMVREKL